MILISASPLAMFVPSNSPLNDFKDLVAYAKARPGKVTYGSGGSGSTGHIVMDGEKAGWTRFAACTVRGWAAHDHRSDRRASSVAIVAAVPAGSGSEIASGRLLGRFLTSPAFFRTAPATLAARFAGGAGTQHRQDASSSTSTSACAIRCARFSSCCSPPGSSANGRSWVRRSDRPSRAWSSASRATPPAWCRSAWGSRCATC